MDHEISPNSYDVVEDYTNLHYELAHSRDYGDRQRYPDAAKLREIGDYWRNEEKSGERSPRSLEGIRMLLGRIAFELKMRHTEMYTTDQVFNEMVADIVPEMPNIEAALDL